MNETIRYYDDHCGQFVSETFDIDMSSVYRPFLELLPSGGRILDAGCGSGRDALAFSELGYDVEAFDASEGCVREARLKTGLQIEHQRFEDLTYRDEFDGIWACASLLHVRREQLGEVLHSFCLSLRPEGVVYLSFKEGSGDRQKDGRWFTDFTAVEFRQWLDTLQGWRLVNLWLTEDQRPTRQHERWVNGLIRKLT